MTQTKELPWYRTETWLAVELSAFLPIALGFLLPAFRIPLFSAAALLSVTGLTMLFLRKPTPRDLSAIDESSFAHEARRSE